MTKRLKRLWQSLHKITQTDLLVVLCFFLSGMGRVLRFFSPFGSACVAALLSCGFSAKAILPVAFGQWIGNTTPTAFRQLLAYLLLVGVSAKPKLMNTPFKCRLFCAACMFVANLIYGAFADMSVYDWLIWTGEICMSVCLIVPYQTVFSFFTTRKMRKSADEKELISLAWIVCGCMSGLSGLALPYDIQVVGVISTFILFFCAYNFSFGVCGVLGTVLGLFASLSNPALMYSIGSYSVAALVCRACKPYGKSGIVLGFVLSNAVITFYINGSTQILINLAEILIAGGVFLVIPAKKLETAKESLLVLINRKEQHEKREREEFKEMAVKRLNRVAEAFSVLAASFVKSGEKRKFSARETVQTLAENVYTRVCGTCAHRRECALCETECRPQLMQLLEKTGKRGWAELYDLKNTFKNNCMHADRMVLECNKVYELYRVNQVWENRIAENRVLVSRQLQDVSGVMRSLADELETRMRFENAAEQNIITVLDGLGIQVSQLAVLRDLNNRLTAEMAVLGCRGNRVCEREIKTVLKKATGKPFSYVRGDCNKDKCFLRYRESENFELDIGIARVRPQTEQMFGDSYAIIRPENGKVVLALSDGMGCGRRAAQESGETVSLLEHLLLAGIDRETAIKLINSVLILKSYDESFATLDLLLVDLFSGESEFVKTGSACSYVYRNGEVAVVAAEALPTGIIGEMETANCKLILKDGDMILLASDGVTDISIDDKWIVDLMKALANEEAQSAADKIMKEAMRRVISCKDDMTVLFVRISEK